MLCDVAVMLRSLLSVAVVFLAGSQNIEPFIGVWEARLNGALPCGFEFTNATQPAGTDPGCFLAFDRDGNLIDSGPKSEARPIPLSRVSLESGTLRFEIDPETPTRMTRS